MELLRLVTAKLPITEFYRDQLSTNGHIISIHDGDGVGLRARNSMAFRVVADVFVPAGGRSGYIHHQNWQQFFLGPGKPSSRLIVEGGCRFVSKQARHELSKKGVLVVSDLSSTKCGVICSSYEVIAGMLLNETEFLSIKGAFVGEVLARLR